MASGRNIEHLGTFLSRSKIEPNEARECVKLGNKVRMNGKGWCDPVVRSLREVFVGRNVDFEGTVTMSGAGMVTGKTEGTARAPVQKMKPIYVYWK